MGKKIKASKEGLKNNYNYIIAETFEKDKIFVHYNKKKNPINVITKKFASVKNPKHWVDYKTALISLKNSSKFKGIGIVLGKTSKGNLCGIDIDNCINKNGVISKEAQKIIEFFDSYTEISPSGKGIHILFFAKKKGNLCKVYPTWCKCLEMYDKGRYFTLSCNIIRAKGIENRQEECNYIYKEYFKCNNTTNVPVILQNEVLPSKKKEDYVKQFESALSRDKVLNDYWNGKRPFSDESSNDFGFIRKLSYWLGEKIDLIKEYFLESPYFASKDDFHKGKCILRKDYLLRTILKTIGRN